MSDIDRHSGFRKQVERLHAYVSTSANPRAVGWWVAAEISGTAAASVNISMQFAVDTNRAVRCVSMCLMCWKLSGDVVIHCTAQKPAVIMRRTMKQLALSDQHSCMLKHNSNMIRQ